jgi:hypothetical protein
MSGLTKKELVLAGLIIVILGIGLYYKVMIPRREKEYAVTCAQNLRYVSLAMLQYTQDYDDTFPRAWFGKDSGPSDTKTNYKWMDAIFPYVKKESVFNCPKDKSNRPYHFRSGVNYGSYAINGTYFASGDNFSPPVGRKVADCYSNTVLVVEAKGDFQMRWPNAKSTPAAKWTDESFNFANLDSRHGISYPGRATFVWTGGVVNQYSQRQNAAPKTINGQMIYTGFTIEDD